jgi:hypothetical protein
MAQANGIGDSGSAAADGGSSADRVLSERACAIYGEPILDVDEAGTLTALNQTAEAFL